MLARATAEPSSLVAPPAPVPRTRRPQGRIPRRNPAPTQGHSTSGRPPSTSTCLPSTASTPRLTRSTRASTRVEATVAVATAAGTEAAAGTDLGVLDGDALLGGSRRMEDRFV